MNNSSIYTLNGAVPLDETRVYIQREADETLFQHALAGELAYVLTARQMGKTSLMIRTMRRLQEQGVQTAVVELAAIGVETTQMDQWFFDIIDSLADAFMLQVDPWAWWQAHAHLGYMRRLTRFFSEVILEELSGQVIVFFDEIDSTIKLPFSDDFFAFIRSTYNARSLDPALSRLSFVLIGTASPSELIADPKRTPFNIGHQIELADFSLSDAMPLAAGFSNQLAETREQILSWILAWTHGHPYLTQQLCALIPTLQGPVSRQRVRGLVDSRFFDADRKDDNLQFVQRALLERPPQSLRFSVLEMYRNILLRLPVRNNNKSLAQSHLKLAGVVRLQEQFLSVRNRIYRRAFGVPWVWRQYPLATWWRTVPFALKGALLFILILLAGLLFATGQALQQRDLAIAQEAVALRQERVRLAQSAAALSSSIYLRENDTELATLLALEAAQIYQEEGEAIDWLVDGSLRPMLESPYFNTTLRGHNAWVWSVAFDPAGRWLASSSGGAIVKLEEGEDENTIRLWELADPAAKPLVLQGHTARVYSIAFHPTEPWLVSSSRDNTVRIWDLSAPDNIHPEILLEGGTGEQFFVTFDPSGRWLASAGEYGEVRVWDTEQLASPPLLLPGDERQVRALAFDPNGRWLAASTVHNQDQDKPSVLRLWKVDTFAVGTPTFQELVISNWGQGRSVTFSPDGTWLAASNEHVIRLWNMAEIDFQDPQPVTLQGHTDAIKILAFDPTSRILASGANDKTVRLWDMGNPGSPADILRGHDAPLRAVAFDQTGQWLASGGFDGNVMLWDADTPLGAPLRLTGHEGPLKAVTFSASGQWLVTSAADGTARVWERSFFGEGSPLILPGHGGAVQSVAIDSSERWIATGSRDRILRVWDRSRPERSPWELRGHQAPIRAVVFGPDNRWIISGSEGGELFLWRFDPETETVVGPGFVRLPDHEEQIWYLAVDSEQGLFASSSIDGQVKIWSLGELTWDALQPVTTLVQDAPVTSVAMVTTGGSEWVITGSDDSFVRLLSTNRSTSASDNALADSGITLLTGHSAEVWSVTVDPTGTWIASGSEDNSVNLWRLQSPEDEPISLIGHGRPVATVAFDPLGQYVASGGVGGEVLLHWLPENIVAVGCDAVRRNLTVAEWTQYFSGEPYRTTCPQYPEGQ